jgi:hypothetical protein
MYLYVHSEKDHLTVEIYCTLYYIVSYVTSFCSLNNCKLLKGMPIKTEKVPDKVGESATF